MATTRENQQFASSLFPSNLLDEAIDWIAKNMNPHEVFDSEALSEWAEDNGFVKGE